MFEMQTGFLSKPHEQRDKKRKEGRKGMLKSTRVMTMWDKLHRKGTLKGTVSVTLYYNTATFGKQRNENATALQQVKTSLHRARYLPKHAVFFGLDVMQE